MGIPERIIGKIKSIIGSGLLASMRYYTYKQASNYKAVYVHIHNHKVPSVPQYCVCVSSNHHSN